MSTQPEEHIDALQLAAERMTVSAVRVIRTLFAVTGVLALTMGIVLLVWPTKTLKFVAVLMGLYFIGIAVVRLFAGISAKGLPAGWRVLDIFTALLLLLGGVFMMRYSSIVGAALALTVVIIVGISWIFEGVLALIESGRHPNAGWSIAFGILSIMAGLVVLITPTWSTAALFVFAGISLIVMGITSIIRAIRFGKDSLNALG